MGHPWWLPLPTRQRRQTNEQTNGLTDGRHHRVKRPLCGGGFNNAPSMHPLTSGANNSKPVCALRAEE